jgi:NAD dependent epimerase/dehydratase family enzyme
LNATAPEPVQQREFAATLARVLARPAFLPAPAFALRAALGAFSQELLASRRVLPERARKGGFSFRFPRLEDSLRDLLG